MRRLPPHADVDAQSRADGLATPASSLHGSLCGWLAGGGAATVDWPAHVLVDDQLRAPAPDTALALLGEVTAAQLGDRSFNFQLLMPDDEAPLVERSGALFDWCRGFLGGFGLSAGAAQGLSDESREALEDIARLAAAQPQDDGDAEDEDALEELVEFVRVASLLLHGDCVLAAEHRGRLN